MEQLIVDFVNALKQLSYAGIVIALTFEFVPAELVLPLAGFWVYEGDFALLPTIIAGTIGGTTGPLTLYALGRFGGRPFVEKYGKYLFIRPKHLLAADRFFEKYGSGVAFFGRFVPGIRTLISIPCGMTKMNVGLFALYTFMAMLPITAAYVYLGYKLGTHWERVGPLVKPYVIPAGVLCICLFAAYILLKRRKERRAESSGNNE